ncbi:MAG TPA: hypothetical protein VFW71_05635 [Actinomycetota bacterium]|nr:hypothetical protein [Actinomycetota bacterium]
MAEQGRCGALRTDLRTRPGALRASAAAGAAALLLAACGSPRPSRAVGPSAADLAQARVVSIIAAAPAATLAQGTASVSLTATRDASGDNVTMVGVDDFATHRLQAQLAIPGGGTIAGVFDNGVVYEKIPGLAAQDGGKPWLKIDLPGLEQNGGALGGLGQMLEQELSTTQSNPDRQLDLLNGVSGTVSTVGDEPIGGVPTTHYWFTTDLNKVIASLSGDARSAFQQLATALGTGSPLVDVWIDGQGVVRQLHIAETYDPKAGAAPYGLPASALPRAVGLTITYSNFGAPAVITDPPPGQTADLSQLLPGSPNGGTPAV